MTGRYNALLRRVAHRKLFSALGRRVVPVDRWIERKTHGRLTIVGHNAVPQLLLTTTGRRTGQLRTTPVLYARSGDDWVVVATNWGQPHHPAWSSNLIAEPDATIELARDRIDVRAALAKGAEREQLWAIATAEWPAYDTYATRTGREIRVFRLTRR
jgi:deazaflavin-dependent oxidoreductase (nitroreductase family)